MSSAVTKSTVSVFSSDPAMQSAVMAAVLACLVVVTSVGAYIQYAHASEFRDEAAQKNVSTYMAISLILLLAGLVLAPLVCFQAGVWSTRTGVPVEKNAQELAFMPPMNVIIFYSAIGALVLINALLSIKSHRDFILNYDEEQSPFKFIGTVKWSEISRIITYVMWAAVIATVVMVYIIARYVNNAARASSIDFASGIAISVLKPESASEIRTRLGGR